jgi:hypothetical protein
VSLKWHYWTKKQQLKMWFWKVSGLQAELDRRATAQMNYLADQHAQAVRKEREQLQRLITPLIRAHVERRFNDFNMSYTVTISDRLLYQSRNDRQAMVSHLAKQIAHELMAAQPVTVH